VAKSSSVNTWASVARTTSPRAPKGGHGSRGRWRMGVENSGTVWGTPVFAFCNRWYGSDGQIRRPHTNPNRARYRPFSVCVERHAPIRLVLVVVIRLRQQIEVICQDGRGMSKGKQTAGVSLVLPKRKKTLNRSQPLSKLLGLSGHPELNRPSETLKTLLQRRQSAKKDRNYTGWDCSAVNLPGPTCFTPFKR
jgi:hypothetical protein